MNIYIRSATSISPRHGSGEPDYKGLIDAKALRRMSRIIRMGVAAAGACLREAGVKEPDAIVTGTACGCLEDTGLFLRSMIERKEEMLQPATFIQSTHHTVGAQIALILQCTRYNNTFVHRGFSFESALLDASLLLQEGDAATVLAGAVDEVTADSKVLLTRFGLYRHPVGSDQSPSPGGSNGPQPGEGAAFFLLSAQPSADDYACLEGMATFYKPADEAEIDQQVAAFLEAQDAKDIDLVISGADGQLPAALAGKPVMPYKQLCGEYATASAFALWMAAGLIKTGVHKKILIYNAYLGIHHSLFLLSAGAQKQPS